MSAKKMPKDMAVRRAAAMSLIRHVPPEQRIQLLLYVVLGSKKIDAAIKAKRDAKAARALANA